MICFKVKPARILILLFLTGTLFSCPAQTIKKEAILLKSDSLVKEKKYASAFELLNKADPGNKDPDLVMQKEEIALNDYVSSISHQIFSFRDIGRDENILDYRGREGSSTLYPFPVNEILDSLIKVYPQNIVLYKALGDYYYEVHIRYGDSWLKKKEELLQLIEDNYRKAADNGLADYMVWYVLGYVKLAEEDYSESIPFFMNSIGQKNDYPTAHYNLAYACLYTDRPDTALVHAIRALDLYTEPNYKGDAARMVAVAYENLGQEEKAIRYYEESNRIDPGNYYSLRPLLGYYLRNNRASFDSTREAFFLLGPENPTIYNDLGDLFYAQKKTEELIVWLKSKFKTYKELPEVTGNLYFYLARCFLESDKKQAREYLLKAKEVLLKVYAPDHEVFGIIDDTLKSLE
jgi:tetratricopeptide (TPR) repeat protein